MNDTLNTNEVKDASGTEVEFRKLEGSGRRKVWAKVNESYALQHRITLNHQETGTGLKRVRRSVLRVDKQSISDIDTTLTITNSAYTVTVTPVGAMSSNTEAKNVLAELGSLLHTSATTTHLYDGTGNGAVDLLAGSV